MDRKLGVADGAILGDHVGQGVEPISENTASDLSNPVFSTPSSWLIVHSMEMDDFARIVFERFFVVAFVNIKKYKVFFL